MGRPAHRAWLHHAARRWRGVTSTSSTAPRAAGQVFPEADFLFLTHVCTNVARAFAVVHRSGHVIGDVNHGNLLVGPNGTVTLIDCDSFQFRNGSKTYTCDVGTDLFTPPELHNRSLKAGERTSNHDSFGLAVLLFHLLFMGRHPFAGRTLGRETCPSRRPSRSTGSPMAQIAVLQPHGTAPGTVPLETMGTTISEYFVRAVLAAGSRVGGPMPGPGLPHWRPLKAGLQTCSLEPRHQYPGHLECVPVVRGRSATASGCSRRGSPRLAHGHGRHRRALERDPGRAAALSDPFCRPNGAGYISAGDTPVDEAAPARPYVLTGAGVVYRRPPFCPAFLISPWFVAASCSRCAV